MTDSTTAAATPAAGSTSTWLGGAITLGSAITTGRLGFGAMHLTGSGVWGEPADPAAARRVLRRALDLGVRFIDTADAYGPEVSEEIIAAALYPYPKDLIIATKGGLVRPSAGRWDRNGRPEHLRAACEASLRRLRVERIDLYQLHAPDPRVPIEDSMGTLADLQAQGKVGCVGVSNVSVAELRRAGKIVDVVSVQNRYNLADRSSDDVLGECARLGIAFLPWRPLSSDGDRRRTVLEIARARDVSAAQIAIAWLLARSPVMLPIPGTASLRHIDDNCAAAGLRLSAEEIAALA
ncbi:MAG: aldo/keto reductase [Rhodospirillales bacterium]|nr:aldo/keto reductase [Rhodospirillales bacterium]